MMDTDINTELRQLESMIDRSFEVASQYLTAEDIADVQRSMTATMSRVKTAGEVKFVKEWEQNDSTQRNFDGQGWEPDLKAKKTMAKALWSLAMAFGHLHTGYRIFSKVRASSVSPDGLMGGRGYIMTVPDMRTKMAEAIEILSTVTDTLHDDLKGPHMERQRTDADTEKLMAEAEQVMDNPEDAHKIEEKSTVADDVAEEAKAAGSPDVSHDELGKEKKQEKTSSRQSRIASRVVARFLSVNDFQPGAQIEGELRVVHPDGSSLSAQEFFEPIAAGGEDWPSHYWTREHQYAPLEEPDDLDTTINNWSGAFSSSLNEPVQPTMTPTLDQFREDIEWTDDFGVSPRDETVDFLRSRP